MLVWNFAFIYKNVLLNMLNPVMKCNSVLNMYCCMPLLMRVQTSHMHCIL